MYINTVPKKYVDSCDVIVTNLKVEGNNYFLLSMASYHTWYT